MRPPSLETLVPGLKEARAHERLVRSMAFARVEWTLCGSPAVQLTPRIRLELQLANNAFSNGAAPTRADVFQVLWRLNPRFSRKLWPAAWMARRKVSRLVMRFDLGKAVEEIAIYLNSMMQDLPEGGDNEQSANPNSGYVHWMAAEQHFYLSNYNGFSPQDYKDTPYVELQQLYRAYRLNKEEHPNFINYSDTLIGRWQREQINTRIPRGPR